MRIVPALLGLAALYAHVEQEAISAWLTLPVQMVDATPI
jgi:hypothetical protein